MSQDDRPTQVTQVMQLVAQHLARHPRAGDTREGVRRYWLPAGTAYDAAVVDIALRHLVDDGVVRETLLPSGEPWFCGTRGDA